MSDTVKAGTYQLVALQWDQIVSKPTEPLDYVRHRRGDTVELNAADARRLVAAGAVVEPGSVERALAEQALATAQIALAGLPEDVRAQLVAGLTGDSEPATQPSTARKSRQRKAVAGAKADGQGTPTGAPATGTSGEDGDDTNQGDSVGSEGPAAPEGSERPLNAAVKPLWVKAVAAVTSMSEEDANGLEKPELIAAYDAAVAGT